MVYHGLSSRMATQVRRYLLGFPYFLGTSPMLSHELRDACYAVPCLPASLEVADTGARRPATYLPMAILTEENDDQLVDACRF
jgi:hypothetical protein